MFEVPPNGSRLSCGAELERSQIKDYHRERGADSFKRWLGCAPILFARIWPSHRRPEKHDTDPPRHRSDVAASSDAQTHPPGTAPNLLMNFHSDAGSLRE